MEEISDCYLNSAIKSTLDNDDVDDDKMNTSEREKRSISRTFE